MGASVPTEKKNNRMNHVCVCWSVSEASNRLLKAHDTVIHKFNIINGMIAKQITDITWQNHRLLSAHVFEMASVLVWW